MRIAIIGAGPGGICAAIKLKDAGFDDLVILERHPGVGGTWYQNRYPGCACDVQSHLYSFSFEPNPHWSRPYAPQREILAYLERTAEKHGVLPHCRFGCDVRGATWDESHACWTLDLASGEQVEADVVISALGMFNQLAYPDIEGLDEFAGTTFHSARWNWDHDLTGERVAVIGSAASAVQLVPEIVKQAAQVHLFQRTANWVLPKDDAPYTEEQLAAFRSNPEIVQQLRDKVYEYLDLALTFGDPRLNAELEAACLRAMEVVDDPEVRTKLVPDHPFGCKRPLLSNDFYPAFNRPNLELVTDPIARITGDAVATRDGTLRRVDTLVLATGFQTTKFLSAIDVVGRDGRRLDDAWNDGAQAYLGITTSGFPNLFMLYGPNTNNGSMITMLEYQVDHVLAHVRRLARERLAWVDVKPDAMARYNDDLQVAIGRVDVWQAGCNGYYRAPSGRVVTQWPYGMREFRERAATLDPDHFDVATR